MKMSRIEGTMRIALAYSQAFNQHDVAGMTAAMHDDSRFEGSAPGPDGRLITGKEAIQQYWQTFFQRLPEIQMDVEDLFGYGFRCVMRWRCDWVDGLDQAAYIRGVDIFLVKNGAIQEQYSYIKGNPKGF
jgi:predicted SnoaL-like aldol condensation-catalyzing enzyme